MRIYRNVMLFSFVIFACPVFGQAKGSYTLRYKFQTGRKSVYQTIMNVQAGLPGQTSGAGGYAMNVNGNTTFTVLKTLPDGSGRLAVIAPNFILGNSGKASSKNARTAHYDMTPLGQLRNVKLPNTPEKGSTMAGLMNTDALATNSVMLPSRSVKPGDVWSMTRANPIKGSKPLLIKTRFVQLQKVGNVLTALLRSFYTIPISSSASQQGMGSMKLNGKVLIIHQVNLALKEGEMLKTGISGGGPITMTQSGRQGGAPMKIQLQLTVSASMVKK